MKGKFVPVAIFAAGAALGSAVAWYVTKNKYEKILQDEINSCREVFRQRRKELDDLHDTVKEIQEMSEQEEEPDIVREDDKNDEYEYGEIIDENGYVINPEESPYLDEEEVNPENLKSKPYVISPDDFDTIDYEVQTYMWYAGDNTLTDDMDFPIVDIDGTVGEDAVNHFGEYEPDAVHVRNDQLQMDFEILYDDRSFSEVKELRKNFRQGIQ